MVKPRGILFGLKDRMRKISFISLMHYIPENTDLCALSQEPLLYSKMQLVKTYHIGWHHKLLKISIY